MRHLISLFNETCFCAVPKLCRSLRVYFMLNQRPNLFIKKCKWPPQRYDGAMEITIYSFKGQGGLRSSLGGKLLARSLSLDGLRAAHLVQAIARISNKIVVNASNRLLKAQMITGKRNCLPVDIITSSQVSNPFTENTVGLFSLTFSHSDFFYKECSYDLYYLLLQWFKVFRLN